MRKSFSVVLWILIGGLASGLGVGYFLRQANNDRARLLLETRLATEEANASKALSERIAKEANQKITNATEEVARAQELVTQYERERKLLTKAVTLSPLSRYQAKTWPSFMDLSLGVRAQYPTEFTVTSTEDGIFFTETLPAGESDTWLTLTPYDISRESSSIEALQSTSTVAYLSADGFFVGTRGSYPENGGTVYVLRSHTAPGRMPFLIWAKCTTKAREAQFLSILSTLVTEP